MLSAYGSKKGDESGGKQSLMLAKYLTIAAPSQPASSTCWEAHKHEGLWGDTHMEPPTSQPEPSPRTLGSPSLSQTHFGSLKRMCLQELTTNMKECPSTRRTCVLADHKGLTLRKETQAQVTGRAQ